MNSTLNICNININQFNIKLTFFCRIFFLLFKMYAHFSSLCTGGFPGVVPLSFLKEWFEKFLHHLSLPANIAEFLLLC